MTGDRERLATKVAIGALLALGAFIVYLLFETEASEITWQRRVYLLSAVEAIAFAGAGWLFGREVHRQQAEAAENRAEKAEAAAAGASAAHERGMALKHAVLAAAETTAAPPPRGRFQPGIAPAPQAPPADPAMAQLAAQARALFPEAGDGA